MMMMVVKTVSDVAAVNDTANEDKPECW